MALLRKAADLISERSIEIGAAVAPEVGKNRLESIGDVEETADLIRYYCDQMEANNGFVKTMLVQSRPSTTTPPTSSPTACGW